MKPNYRIDTSFAQMWHKKNIFMIFNYEHINKVQVISGLDINLYDTENLVGFWKIKKLKQ